MIPNDSLILDTHVWVWWVNQDKKLPASLHERIAQANRVMISAVSIYELLQAVGRGRLLLALEVKAWLRAATADADIEVAPVNARVAQIAAELPPVHGDPLDRMIIATALATSQPLISLDRKFAAYPKLSELLIAR